MPARCRGCAIRRVPGAVVRRLCGIGRLWRGRFMVKIGSCAYSMSVRSYYFGSGLLGLMRVSQRSQCHVVRHRVARPAAQQQQGDHEGEEPWGAYLNAMR